MAPCQKKFKKNQRDILGAREKMRGIAIYISQASFSAKKSHIPSLPKNNLYICIFIYIYKITIIIIIQTKFQIRMEYIVYRYIIIYNIIYVYILVM